MDKLSTEDQALLFNCIQDIPDFPKPGIIFKDMSDLLTNEKAMRTLYDHLARRYESKGIDLIAGIESRGFIFGSALAATMDVGFVPIRKRGKLPGKVISENYSLEYGEDTLEMKADTFAKHPDASVLLIDDVLATGGTAKAGISLIEKAGGKLVGSCFILHLAFLKGESTIGPSSEVYSVLSVT